MLRSYLAFVICSLESEVLSKLCESVERFSPARVDRERKLDLGYDVSELKPG